MSESFMERLRFRYDRVLRNGKRVAATSANGADMLLALDGRSVAIVGNSRALADASFGATIDATDIVVRINSAPMPSARSHGSRTNWLALAVALDETENSRIGAERFLWMSHKRKRLPYWVASGPGFYLHPLDKFRRLADTLGAPPTTGLMVIDLVARSKATSIDLFGFDFFASQSLSGRRTATQVPHDFAAERKWVETLAKNDARLIIHGQNPN